MCRFIETIKFDSGHFQNLAIHQERIQRTFNRFFPEMVPFELTEVLQQIQHPGDGRFRCTFEYDAQLRDVRILPYTIRPLSRLILQQASIHYRFKYADRSCFDPYLLNLTEGEEVLIVKNGCITDTSYTNVALYDGHKWFTPDTPLLEGTRRELLIRQGMLMPARIKPADINNYTHISLINAMLDLNELIMPIGQIIGSTAF